jgi:hypothetical protein
MAVEFCILMAGNLKGKTEILVKDNKVLETVSRILNARENYGKGVKTASSSSATTNDVRNAPAKIVSAEYYDDFADFDGPIGSTEEEFLEDASDKSDPEIFSSNDVDSFRKQLIADWQSSDDIEVKEDDSDVPMPTPLEKRYRLASILGDSSNISSGPDMASHVTKAVIANAMPTDDEETIIILSAASKAEMIAIRALVAKYEGKKKIILVNCSLNPPPRELMMAQTVYSVQPLIARPKVSDTNIFGPGEDAPPNPPKIVVMRRYPRDWEIFVDVGEGFELAATIPPGKVDTKKGPSMQLTAGIVKRHLSSRMK